MSTRRPRSAASSHSSRRWLAPVGHGALEVRNAADHVHAQVQRALQVVQPAGRAQHAVLRKGHQLQVEVGRHALLDFQQRVHRQQARSLVSTWLRMASRPLATAQSQ
jgi:hypothetical protein